MAAACTIALPSFTLAKPKSPFVFLAHEFWGDRVIEPAKALERSRLSEPSRLEIVPSLENFKDEKKHQTAKEEMAARDRDVDEFLRLTADRLPTYVEQNRRSRRKTILSAVITAASAVGISVAFAAAGFAGLSLASSAAVHEAMSQPGATAYAAAPIDPLILNAPKSVESAKVEDEALVGAFAAGTGVSALFGLEAELFGRDHRQFYAAAILERAEEEAEGGSTEEIADTAPRLGATGAAIRSGRSGRARAQARPETVAAQQPTVEPSGESSISFERDELLLPQTLTAGQVSIGMRRVSRLVRNCVIESRTTTPVSITIRGETGRVDSVRLPGGLAGTSEGDCIERALHRAHFPRFSNDELELSSYPLVIR